MSPEQFQQALADHDITLSAEQMQQFVDYHQLLVETNERVNLIRITEKDEVYLRHLYDSITGALAEPYLESEELTLCGISAGTGLPSLPLKIASPQLKVVIVDSLNKWIASFEALAAKLGLTDATLIYDRAETFSAKNSPYREKFDTVTARAVARLSVLSELYLPAAEINGELIVYKASATPGELQQGGAAIKQFGEKVQKTVTLTLLETDEERNIIAIDKIKTIPNKYPRRPELPSKRPIQ